MKAPLIQTTNQYTLFKRIESNREVNPAHLKRLTESIRNKNMLHLYPLIVNDAMEIIDGQHRLRAAEALKIDVHYIVDSSVTKADIAMMNNNRKGWSARDFVAFYAKEGKKEYQHLHDLLRTFPRVTVGCGIKLLDKDASAYFISGGKFSQKLKEGRIDGTNHAIAMRVADLCDKLNVIRYYSFAPQFMMAAKSAILKSTRDPNECCERILQKVQLLPKVIDENETCLKILHGICDDKSAAPKPEKKIKVSAEPNGEYFNPQTDLHQ